MVIFADKSVEPPDVERTPLAVQMKNFALIKSLDTIEAVLSELFKNVLVAELGAFSVTVFPDDAAIS